MNVAQHTARDNPMIEADGTITATIIGAHLVAGSITLNAQLPAGLSHERTAGRYFLARCAEATAWARRHDWTFSLRRPLFAVGWRSATQPGGVEEWHLTSSELADPGIEWLAARPAGAAVSLAGPLGNGFELPTRARHLAAISHPARISTLFPLIHEMLDRGGRVVLLLQSDEAIDPALLERLPLAAEIHRDAPGEAWQARLAETLTWADYVAAALPAGELPALAHTVQRVRRRIEPGFAHVLADTRLACGYGVCHLCLVALGAGRWTRACVHGPVFDLVALSR